MDRFPAWNRHEQLLRVNAASRWGSFISCLVFCIFAGNAALAKAETTYLSDDFENGLGHWLASGSDWAVTDTTAVSPGHSVTDSPLGNYPPNSNATLELALPINLSDATAPVLSFWEKYFTNYGDMAIVEISDDGGFTWTQLARRDPRNFVSTWTFTEISLQGHLKPLVKIRFRLRADPDGNVSDGWYLDDVAIRDADPVRTPFPFSDDFNGSLDNWRVSGSDWTQIATDFVSGPLGLTDSVGANYPANTNATLELAHPIDLSQATAPVLSFWEKYFTNFGDVALIEISDDGGFNWAQLAAIGQRSFVSTWNFTEISLQGHLQPLVKIRFRLRADPDGNLSDGWYLDDVAIREGGDPLRTPFPFYDGFDDSLRDWRVSGSDWTQIATDFVSGPQGLTDSVGGDYPANTNATLELAHPIDLSQTTTPVLSFWEKYFTNFGDVASVEISDDGGSNWTELARHDPRSFVSTFTPVRLDLSQHKAALVKVRFRLRADTDGNVSDGWYLDNVEIFDLLGPRCDQSCRTNATSTTSSTVATSSTTTSSTTTTSSSTSSSTSTSTTSTSTITPSSTSTSTTTVTTNPSSTTTSTSIVSTTIIPTTTTTSSAPPSTIQRTTTSTVSTTVSLTTTTLAQCQQTMCDGTGCGVAPAAEGTACDNGDACGPDTCHDGTCVNPPLCDGVTASQPLTKDRTPLPKLTVTCSFDGADGTCEAQGFVPTSVRDELLARRVRSLTAPSADADEVAVTKRAQARFNKFGLARFALKLNSLGKRLVKKLRKGEKLPVDVRFQLKNGEQQLTLKRVVNLARN